MNGVLEALAERPDTELNLLFSEQWLDSDGRLPSACPLRTLPFRTFPGKESPRERLWKLTNHPKMDCYVSPGTDWIYCPMETRLPVSSVPVAMTLHDVQPFETDLAWSNGPAQRRNRRMWGMWLPKAFREARLVFTVSEFSKQRMVELLGASPEKVVVSGNGVDPAFFLAGSVTADLKRPAHPYIFTVGGLRTQKGGGHFLAVARLLRKTIPDLRFIIAGGPHDPVLVSEAKSIGGFEFPGMVPDDTMPGLMKGASCLLFLSPYEGFGMPPLEAMACGTPAIVADRASLPEVVSDAALIVEPEAAEPIAELIVELMSDSAFRDTLIAKGRKHASEFTWERVAERVHNTLQERS